MRNTEIKNSSRGHMNLRHPKARRKAPLSAFPRHQPIDSRKLELLVKHPNASVRTSVLLTNGGCISAEVVLGHCGALAGPRKLGTAGPPGGRGILLRARQRLGRAGSARSASNSWNWILFGKPCGKSGKRAGRATGLVCRHPRAHQRDDCRHGRKANSRSIGCACWRG